MLKRWNNAFTVDIHREFNREWTCFLAGKEVNKARNQREYVLKSATDQWYQVAVT
jgi:hypothetical protein